MKQENQAKITIYEGNKNGDEIEWGQSAGEKEYQYAGEASEALEAFTWEQAEEVCDKKLNASFALLFKCSKRENADWGPYGERVLLYFAEEEKSK
jgi:hypothetical protein